MAEKADEEKFRYTTLLNDLDKTSLQVIRKLNDEVERAWKEKEMKAVLHSKLQETRRKMKDLEAGRKSDFKL